MIKHWDSLISSKNFVIDPTHWLSKSWKVFLLLFLLIQIIIIPFQAAFNLKNNYIFLGFLSYIIFSINILINLNTSFYYEAKEYSKRKQIFVHYRNGQGILDLVNLVLSFFYFENHILMLILFCFRLINFMYTLKVIQ